MKERSGLLPFSLGEVSGFVGKLKGKAAVGRVWG